MNQIIFKFKSITSEATATDIKKAALPDCSSSYIFTAISYLSACYHAIPFPKPQDAGREKRVSSFSKE